MGRFSAIFLILLGGACGDNLDIDEERGPGRPDEVNPNGNSEAVPRYVPGVCAVRSWQTSIASDPAMNISVAPRPLGATLLAVPQAGGSITGFVLDSRMDMIGGDGTKVAIANTFNQVAASFVGDRVVSTALDGAAVYLHMLDDDLANPQYLNKLPGTQVAEPAFFQANADLIMPIAGDDGLWFHKFDDSLELTESRLMVASKPARSMAAAQLGTAIVTAWSTDTECYMMMTSVFEPGSNTRLPVACNDPRISVNQKTGEGVMVFDSTDGVRLMHMHASQFGGSARLLRADTTAARTLFDGTNFWVSYLDSRGDVIIGFLDGNRQLVTMSLSGPQPQTAAYEFVMIDKAPWLFALDTEGYTAHRMCVDEQY